MKLIANTLILFVVFTPFRIYSQQSSEKTENPSGYAAPLDIPMFLSGNYGEVRSAHFHSGIDIKTEQVEGKNVLAAKDGYVFRIVVQSEGYGKALYLRHPDGQVTVYGHLRQFIPGIEKYVRAQQYLKKSFEVDLNLPPGLFSFQRNGFLGYSGNTGNSAAPHLHFEIRDSSSVPLNALKYGFDIRDKTSPKINWLAVYPVDKRSLVNGNHEKLLLQVTGNNGNYMPVSDSILVNGNIGLGIETYDFLDNSTNECSPYTISLYVDDKQRFLCRIDSIPFSMASYVNSFADYEEEIKSGRKILKLFVDPNNRLKIYKIALNRGILNITDFSVHAVKIVVKDTYGNESVLHFNMQGTGAVSQLQRKADPTIIGTFRYDTLNLYENRDVRIVVPRNALFTNIDFQYAKIKSDSCLWSSIHQVHNEFTPLLKSYILSIRTSDLPVGLQNKALIAGRGKNGEWISYGGEYRNGFVTTRLKTFGRFFIEVDTISPLVKPVAFKAGDRYSANQMISFSISDSLSGIRNYNGYIDKKWALFEYDAKNNLLTYTLDENRLAQNRSHVLEIIVTDNKENVSIYRADFFY